VSARFASFFDAIYSFINTHPSMLLRKQNTPHFLFFRECWKKKNVISQAGRTTSQVYVGDGKTGKRFMKPSITKTAVAMQQKGNNFGAT
jgi:hypothetical protein